MRNKFQAEQKIQPFSASFYLEHGEIVKALTMQKERCGMSSVLVD